MCGQVQHCVCLIARHKHSGWVTAYHCIIFRFLTQLVLVCTQVRRSEINPTIGGGAGGNDIVQTVSKKYAKQYLYGQLIFWNKHNIADPSASLSQVIWKHILTLLHKP